MGKKILSLCLCSISGLLAISSAVAKPCITYDVGLEGTSKWTWTAGTPWQDITPTTRRCWKAGDYDKEKNRIVRLVTTSKQAPSVYWANTNVSQKLIAVYAEYGKVWVEGTANGVKHAWFTNVQGDSTHKKFGIANAIYCGWDDNVLPRINWGDCVLHID